MGFPFMRAFIALFFYRYFRLVVNLFAFWTFKPIQPPENPTLTSQDVSVIIPTLEGCGDELFETIRTILANEPFELLLVTIEANRKKAERMLATMPASKSRIRLFTVTHPNKRRQMTAAIPEVRTAITIFADDDVSWPPHLLRWILAPFDKDEKYGGVATCQRLRRVPFTWSAQYVWNFLGALYLERRNFDCAATTHIDGGVPCLSGRTVAYRSKILQDVGFTHAFTNEGWWFGKYQLNADDDNFITRWMVSHGWETYIQYHPEAEVQTTLEDNPKFLKQCARWSRSNWRSNLTSMFDEKHIWYRQPWSTYAVHLTTLSPPALLGDMALVFLCHKATELWDHESHLLAMQLLAAWMFTSKFIKLFGHWTRYPIDFLLLPVSILFGYFHGGIKMYAVLTLSVTAWGSRAGADANDAERMRKRTDIEREKVAATMWSPHKL
ncbi:putative polysaccharide synthase Cps1 [Paecilomyces variotii]|uniref:Putative polysaccharide synthase Cps1 n=1 Tax=Byssochlamys spectabilis TaxID=264951 RepID=A0A443HIU0_BYSSP|nr:putative polysaccharide synthase Cps1 [Paecilomyces variotii]RWQ91762.1 putative polysaccharide synthase Cps1 [Paecilomyces variotii]